MSSSAVNRLVADNAVPEMGDTGTFHHTILLQVEGMLELVEESASALQYVRHKMYLELIKRTVAQALLYGATAV